MHCYLVRHAIAEDRESYTGADDALRPLTKKGIQRMRRQAKTLARLCPGLRLILTSPYRRAQQTAAILAEAAEVSRIESEQALEPGAGASKVLEALTAFDLDRIALIGHQPDLGHLASYLLTADELRVDFVFKKGGALAVEMDEPKPGTARLLWMMTPAQLRAVG